MLRLRVLLEVGRSHRRALRIAVKLLCLLCQAGLTGPAVKAEGKCQRLALTGNVAADLKKENNSKGEIAALDLGTTDDAVLGANAFEGR